MDFDKSNLDALGNENFCLEEELLRLWLDWSSARLVLSPLSILLLDAFLTIDIAFSVTNTIKFLSL